MNSRKLICQLMELILLLSVLLALINVILMLRQTPVSFLDLPNSSWIAAEGSGIMTGANVFYELAVLLMLSAPLAIAFAAAVFFAKERKWGMMIVALLLLLVLVVSIYKV